MEPKRERTGLLQRPFCLSGRQPFGIQGQSH